jgi:hypothetical protein
MHRRVLCISFYKKTVQRFEFFKNGITFLSTYIATILRSDTPGKIKVLYFFILFVFLCDNKEASTKLTHMVQVDISQLTGECNGWRQELRQYREEFTGNEAKLRQAASQPLSKDQLLHVEHLHNQVHIQLINIHDLKQTIKVHDRKMNFEMAAFNGTANEDTLVRHENLQAEYQQLRHTLDGLRQEFDDFLSRTT